MKKSKQIRIRVIFCLGVFMVGCALSIPSRGWAQPTENAPSIIHSWAIDKGYYGMIWKLYMEAKESDGEMTKIAAVVDQAGYGRYRTQFVDLAPQFRHYLKGYIQWNTYSTRTPYIVDWPNINVTVSIFDRIGNESNRVVFPFAFGVSPKSQPNLPPPFDREDLPKLGEFHVNLFDPTFLEDKSELQAPY